MNWLASILLLLIILGPGGFIQVDRGVVAQPRKIPVAAIYYQWYGYEHNAGDGWPATGGLGTFHWNDIVFDELITGFVANKPAIGYYASDDEATIAWQLEQMQAAGIDTIIVSWWGWGDVDLDGDNEGYIEQRSHDALIKLLDYIEANDLKFKVALMVEPWMDVVSGGVPGTAKTLSAAKKQMIFDWLWTNVYSVYPDLMFSWDGKPLLCAVGELYFDDDADSANRYTFRSFRFKEADHDPGNSWTWDITQPLPHFQSDYANDGTVILSPRYDEWFLAAAHPTWWTEGFWGRTEPIRIDPYLTENLYDYELRQVYNKRDDVDLIILWAWNSRMEQLYIEPDDGSGAAPAGDSLVRKTNWYLRRLMNGSAFKLFDADWVTVADLRSVLNPINPEQLNVASDVEVDQILGGIISQAQSHVAGYVNRSYGVAPVAVVASEGVTDDESLSMFAAADLSVGDVLQVGLGAKTMVQVKSVAAPPAIGDPHIVEIGVPLSADVKAGEFAYSVSPPYSDVSDVVPDAIKEVTLRIAAAIYNYMVATKTGQLVRFGDAGVEVLTSSVFTDSVRRDLQPYKKARPLGVLWQG